MNSKAKIKIARHYESYYCYYYYYHRSSCCCCFHYNWHYYYHHYYQILLLSVLLFIILLSNYSNKLVYSQNMFLVFFVNHFLKKSKQTFPTFSNITEITKNLYPAWLLLGMLYYVLISQVFSNKIIQMQFLCSYD